MGSSVQAGKRSVTLQQWFVGDFDGDGRDEPGKVFSANGLASMDVYI